MPWEISFLTNLSGTENQSKKVKTHKSSTFLSASGPSTTHGIMQILALLMHAPNEELMPAHAQLQRHMLTESHYTRSGSFQLTWVDISVYLQVEGLS